MISTPSHTTRPQPGAFHRIYNRFAQIYDIALGPILSKGQKMAIRSMDIQPGARVLEVGIGTGLTLPLYRKEQNIVGVDLASQMLAKAQEKVKELGMPHVELKEMSAEDLKFDDNSFDIVFAPSVVSVVDEPDKVIDEMVRVCKPGGTICVLAHFAGAKLSEKLADRIFDPLTKKIIGFRMTTPRNLVENHPGILVILRREVMWSFNFSTLYLLRKKNKE